ncbi:outer membrane protein assembly factor BamD [Vulcaniibacterium thermophilum]|jgi:outer membrane protein assembly factor BamD|uniref:Outer membrane protein assembly factor BamD n=1 Tax=Vulcaniibacterium thermophilum TaxID=1169913 RepID=A0A918Z1K6_9GAMM|nr:outer membrane protein assembly factor BamD [Vulcaniibacterium thermophilum]GHE33073.1 outer membrane protein assembly factor BamD [Vulcaniibacterium thermophilum]
MTPRPAVTRLLLLLLLVAFATSGCARLKGMFKDEDADENQPVETLYEKGHRSIRNGNWDNAEQTFRRLIAQYPYGPYTEQALMETAYAQYKAGKYEDAISTIDRFIRTYPTHRHIAYLYYLRGLANSRRDTVFLQRVWRLDVSRRDLSTPQQAYNDFQLLTERYPNSRYAADARERMVALRNTFARHEIDVALYYLRRGAYVAAAQRAKNVLETYPQSRYQNDAVALLAKAYHGLGNETLAADAERVLKANAPDHAYFSGDWPDYPSRLHKLNPFAGEKSPLDTR